LRAAGVEYDLKRQAETRVWQMFVLDPSGARVELDFGPGEPAPDGAA
jgi:hypothetical protein